MLESIQKMIDDGLVKDKFAVKTADCTMTIRDRVVSASATTATVTLSLPPVSLAEGKIFTIFTTDANATYPVKIQNLDDSKNWSSQGGDISLTGPNDFVVLYSDGISWAILATSVLVDTRKIVQLFKVQPIAIQSDGTFASGTAGETNVMILPDMNFEYNIKGTQDIILPQLAATGLDVGMDQTDNDGVEFTVGISAISPAAFVVGTDAFYAKLKFSITTVAGTDDCAFGFRKAEAYQANFDDYDELASLNVISGNITLETILNGGDTTTTDSTDDWVDAETHELEVRVDIDGVVTYRIDGVAPTTTAVFTFDDTEVVVPFFFMLQANAAQTGALVLKHFECGLL
ncbi:MAG: hypothetical protein ACTSPB_12640 [Candidatus Thorarchaeota archaeon]